MKQSVMTTCRELAKQVGALKLEHKTIGLVPTMGALHEGHLSLIRESLRQTDETVVSIFVNPTQFAPSEDLEKYPRPLETDLEKLESIGVKHVFVPSVDQMYPDRFSTSLVPPAVAKKLEGEFRPSHFAGVVTVVLKLFNLARCDFAFFGQKDYQQQLVIRRMVEDLNVPVEVVVCPIVRETSGLALSSRNQYLSEEEHEIGLSLSRTLAYVEEQFQQGQRDGYTLMGEMQQRLIDAGVTRVDYATIADPETLDTLDRIEGEGVALIAAYVGKTRLIDNRILRSVS